MRGRHQHTDEQEILYFDQVWTLATDHDEYATRKNRKNFNSELPHHKRKYDIQDVESF